MPYSHITAHYHLPRMKEMGRVYWCNTLVATGSSLVAIFVPIFLLKSGYSFTSVLIYMLLQQIFAALTQYPAGRLFAYIQPNFILALGSLLYAIFFGLLATLHAYHWPLVLLAFTWSLNRTIYWAALHYVFSSSRAHKNSGVQIAGLQALAVIAATVAPAVGGIISTLFGITYAYIAAVLLLLMATWPVLSSIDAPKRSFIVMPYHQLMAMRRDALANCFNGIILVAETNLWPLLIYTFVSSYAGIGILSSVIAVSSIFVILYVGRNTIKQGERHFIKEGVATYSLTSIGRMLVQSSTQIFGLNLLAGIGRSLYVTPFMNRYYSNSDGPHRLGYITVMETAFSVGSALFITFLILLSAILSIKAVLVVGLGIVAVCTFGVRNIR